MEDNKKRFKGKIALKHETEADWLKSSYVPDDGEPVLYDPDENNTSRRVKYGDGVHTVKDLPFTGSDIIDENNNVIINEGDVDGKYSIVFGTADEEVIEALVGNAIGYIDIKAPEVNADMAIAIGTNLKVNSSGSTAIGIINEAGAVGYYWHSFDVEKKQITVSTSRPSSVLDSAKAPTNLDKNWKVGDYLTIVNSTTYACCVKIAGISGNVITVDGNFPFTEDTYKTLGIYSYTRPFDRTICAIGKETVISINDTERWACRPGEVNISFGSIVMGAFNTSTGMLASARGRGNLAAGSYSDVSGEGNEAHGYRSQASGRENKAIGHNTRVNGYQNEVIGDNSEASGQGNTVTGKNARAGGQGSKATAPSAQAFGNQAEATGDNSSATGYQTKAKGNNSITDGYITEATGHSSSAHGRETKATAARASANGYLTYAAGENSASFGIRTNAGGINAFTKGGGSNVLSESELSQYLSLSIEEFNTAWNNKKFNAALGGASETGGYNNVAYGKYSFAHGQDTRAFGEKSFTCGWNTQAIGLQAFAAGQSTIANKNNSATFGLYTRATAENQFVIGKYNKEVNEALFIIGNGTSSNRQNAFCVTSSGEARFGDYINDSEQQKIASLNRARLYFRDFEKIVHEYGTGEQRSEASMGPHSISIEYTDTSFDEAFYDFRNYYGKVSLSYNSIDIYDKSELPDYYSEYTESEIHLKRGELRLSQMLYDYSGPGEHYESDLSLSPSSIYISTRFLNSGTSSYQTLYFPEHSGTIALQEDVLNLVPLLKQVADKAYGTETHVLTVDPGNLPKNGSHVQVEISTYTYNITKLTKIIVPNNWQIGVSAIRDQCTGSCFNYKYYFNNDYYNYYYLYYQEYGTYYTNIAPIQRDTTLTLEMEIW